MRKLVYLASPYSHDLPSVREARFGYACEKAAELMRDGVFVLSPIAHTHPIALNGLPKGWEFWEQYDRRLLAACDEVMVLRLAGWETSKGVQAEIKIALETGMPVTYTDM